MNRHVRPDIDRQAERVERLEEKLWALDAEVDRLRAKAPDGGWLPWYVIVAGIGAATSLLGAFIAAWNAWSVKREEARLRVKVELRIKFISEAVASLDALSLAISEHFVELNRLAEHVVQLRAVEAHRSKDRLVQELHQAMYLPRSVVPPSLERAIEAARSSEVFGRDRILEAARQEDASERGRVCFAAIRDALATLKIFRADAAEWKKTIWSEVNEGEKTVPPSVPISEDFRIGDTWLDLTLEDMARNPVWKTIADQYPPHLNPRDD